MDGLRALAALAIVVFHIDSGWLPGGFIGVDIFFVLSGFLITGQIVGQGTAFSFAAFYRRRIQRLWPALACTLLASLAAGWFILAPRDYAALATSALSGLFGVSNVYFYLTQDYFAPSALQKPLLHIWSLSVEEQFYLVWPALLVLGAGAARSRVIRLLAVLSASCGLAGVITAHDPSAAYYMMPTRAFGFALGGLLAVTEHRLPTGKWREIVAAVGLVLVVGALAGFSDATPWPGLYALVPSVGTLLLVAGRDARVSRAVFDHGMLAAIGRASYSIYLVHWPVIAFTAYVLVAPPAVWIKFAQLPIILVLGFLQYWLVEQPLRMPRNGETRRLSPHQQRSVALAAIAATALASTAVLALSGIPQRFMKGVTQQSGELTFAGDACNAKFARCAFGDPDGRRTVYLVGDSHALNLVFGLDGLFRAAGIRGIGLYDHGCLYVKDSLTLDRGVPDKRCAANVAAAFAVLARDKSPVIFAASYLSYAGKTAQRDGTAVPPAEYEAWLGRGLATVLTTLGNRPVLLFGPFYDAGVDVGQCAARGLTEASCVVRDRAQMETLASPVETMLATLSTRASSVKMIRPWQAFCRADGSCASMANGAYLLRDQNHLTNDGSRALVGWARPDIEHWLRQSQ